MGEIPFHRADGEKEFAGDFPVGEISGDQGQYRQLPLAQRFDQRLACVWGMMGQWSVFRNLEFIQKSRGDSLKVLLGGSSLRRFGRFLITTQEMLRSIFRLLIAGGMMQGGRQQFDAARSLSG